MLGGISVSEIVITPEITGIDPYNLDLNLFRFSDRLFSINRIVLIGVYY